MAIRRRPGYSLIELLLATALVGGTLAPALALMRDGIDVSNKTDQRQLLANYAVSKLEEQLAIAANGWSNGTTTGNFSADGFSSLRFIAVRSDAVVDGGLVNQLMLVRVTTFIDDDADSTLDAGEQRTVYRTKVSKLATYAALSGS